MNETESETILGAFASSQECPSGVSAVHVRSQVIRADRLHQVAAPAATHERPTPIRDQMWTGLGPGAARAAGLLASHLVGRAGPDVRQREAPGPVLTDVPTRNRGEG